MGLGGELSKEAKVVMSDRAAGSVSRGLWFKWNHILVGDSLWGPCPEVKTILTQAWGRR